MGNPEAFQSRVSTAPCWAAGRCGRLALSSLPATLHSTQTVRPPERPSSVAWRSVFACPTASYSWRCSLSWAPAGLLPTAGLCHTRLRAEGSGRTGSWGVADKVFRGRVGAEGTLTSPFLQPSGTLIHTV